MCSSPFASFPILFIETEPDEKYIKKWAIIRYVEKKIYAPVYRMSSQKSLPLPDEFYHKTKVAITVSPKAGIIHSKKRVKFHESIQS